MIRRRAAADQKEKIANARPNSTRSAGAGGSSSTMLSTDCPPAPFHVVHTTTGLRVPWIDPACSIFLMRALVAILMGGTLMRPSLATARITSRITQSS